MHEPSEDEKRAELAFDLLAALGGALVLACDEPWLLSLSALAGFVLLSFALSRPSSPVRAFLRGLAFGAAANAVALFSLISLLERFAQLPRALSMPLAVTCWLAQGIPYGLAAFASELLARRGIARTLSFPCALIVALTLCPQLFPWQPAVTQLGLLSFVQVAELGGQTLVSLLLVQLAAFVHDACRRTNTPTALACACLTFALPTSYGLARMPAIERARAHAPIVRLGVAQANLDVDAMRHEPGRRASLRVLRSLTRTLERRRADLTVWGESAYPYPLLRSTTHAPRDERDPLAEAVRGPIVLGLETYDSFDERSPKYNSAWLVERGGALGDRVDKTRLLAFGEFVPLWHALPSLRARFRHPGFSPGKPALLRSDHGAIGVLICYEDLFSEAARTLVSKGARVLLNLTNDAWFGPGREPGLHDLAARLRAVEQRRDLVRAVNTGVSSFTSASGERLHATRPFERTAFVAPARLLEEQTWFARLGDWVTPLCALLLLTCRLRRKRA